MRRLIPSVLVLAAAATAGCSSSAETDETRVRGDTLTVYVSAPRHGVTAAGGQAVTAGARLALSRAGGRAGGRRVRLVAVSSTRPGDELWDPGTVKSNAERARDDPTAIAYIGEAGLGASAVSVPVTNRASILQVSPGDGLTSLTRAPPGRPRGGPERLYPEDRRTFLRLAPADAELARAMLGGVRAAGARRPAIVVTGGIAERELAGVLGHRARASGIAPVAVEALRDEPESAARVVDELTPAAPDVVLLAGVRSPASAALLRALAERLPGVPVLCFAPMAGPSGVEGASPGTRVYTSLVSPRRGGGASAVPAGLAETFPGAVEAEALRGYEAMRVVLDAIERGGPDRGAVVRAGLEARERDSVIGRYRIEPSGEVEGLAIGVTGLDGERPARALPTP